jgi:hypothetical protein
VSSPQAPRKLRSTVSEAEVVQRRKLLAVLGVLLLIAAAAGVWQFTVWLGHHNRVSELSDAVPKSLKPCEEVDANPSLKVDFELSCNDGHVHYYKAESDSDLPRLAREFNARENCPLLGYSRYRVRASRTYGMVYCSRRILFWCDAGRALVANIRGIPARKLVPTWKKALAVNGDGGVRKHYSAASTSACPLK